MLKDDRVRALAIEFGTQWIHVRGFDAFKEKNEKLFPTFDINLRKAIYEESILFFEDLFQNGGSQAKLRDGTEFEGIEGLRSYLLTQKKDTIERLFCRRLLGYALGRSVTLSDQLLIGRMMAEMQKDGGVSNAVLAIVQSKQFRMIRGSSYSDE